MAQGYITKLNYRAKDLEETKKYPALIVGAPYAA